MGLVIANVTIVSSVNFTCHMYSQDPTITTQTTAWVLAARLIVMLTSWTLGFYMGVLKKPTPLPASGWELEFLSLFRIARFQIFFLKGVCFLFHFCVSVCVHLCVIGRVYRDTPSVIETDLDVISLSLLASATVLVVPGQVLYGSRGSRNFGWMPVCR